MEQMTKQKSLGKDYANIFAHRTKESQSRKTTENNLWSLYTEKLKNDNQGSQPGRCLCQFNSNTEFQRYLPFQNRKLSKEGNALIIF